MAFRLACAAFAACVATFAHADGPREIRAGAGIDVIHKRWMRVVSVEIRPASFLAWDNGNYGVGLTYDFGRRTGWNAGIGGIVTRRTDDDLGTRLNLLARGSYCGEHLCLSLSHISHGSGFGIHRHSANSGLNFLILEYRY